MRKGGRKQKICTRGDPDDVISYLFWKEKELGLRRNEVLKNYIGISEGHTHFLLDAVFDIWGMGGKHFQNKCWGLVTKVCSVACSLS